MTIDAATLAAICQQCFALSTNGAVREKERKKYLLLGKELRGDLLNLITASFADATQQVVDANSELENVNDALKTAAESIEAAVEGTKKVTALAKTLDSLLKLAIGFV